MNREYPERPIVGVGAVIVDAKARRVVLVRRGAQPLEGRWSIPGGALELGETLRAGTEREAREETGLAVSAEDLLAVLDRIIPGDNGRLRYHYVLADFLCSIRGGELRAGGDATEVAWAGEDDLEKFQLDKLAVEVIRKAFATARR